jgi:hypothetical protein
VNAGGLKEGVGTASHAPIVQLWAAQVDRAEAVLAYPYAPGICLQASLPE